MLNGGGAKEDVRHASPERGEEKDALFGRRDRVLDEEGAVLEAEDRHADVYGDVQEADLRAEFLRV